MTTLSNQMFENLTSMMSSLMFTDQLSQIKTASIEANFIKKNISAIDNQQSVQDCRISVQSVCDLLNSPCENRVITQKVKLSNKFIF